MYKPRGNKELFDEEFTINASSIGNPLEAIRKDFAPAIHARNLFHTSIAMYDAWAIYNKDAQTYFIGKEVNGFQ
jgi:hypothetical protein